MWRSATSICLIVGSFDDWFSRKYPTTGPLVSGGIRKQDPLGVFSAEPVGVHQKVDESLDGS